MERRGLENIMRLVCHPATPSVAVDSIEVSYERTNGHSLWLRYHIEMPLDSLVLPFPAKPVRTDGLWKTTCFEAFVRLAGTAPYVEYNASPSSQWAAYSFADYRTDMAELPIETASEIGLDASESHFALEVIYDLQLQWAGQPLELGLSAVIEETDGTKSYWALAHPSGAPDFHHGDCFALQLAAPEQP
jgi:hypothetical protein